jgi:tRNA dimethylallyltransferase
LKLLDNISPEQPVLIAGPTASGKSALALELAARQGGTILNADALQVFADWDVLTARPSPADRARAPHALYGHVDFAQPYSVGDWLRALAPYLAQTRPIIVGGTGLYFRALLEGLADIPATPPQVRNDAMARLDAEGIGALLHEIHPDTRARLDHNNPMRVSRAWEVEHATGRPLHLWQDATPPPLIARADCAAIVLDAPKDWLTPRIAGRFDAMLAQGALEEARAVLPRWDPKLGAAKAIGAPALIAHLRGEMTLDQTRAAAFLSTVQYAKRQRTWFRARMRDWTPLDAQALPPT